MANVLCQYATEPSQGVFDFTQGQVIVDFAQGNDQIIRGSHFALMFLFCACFQRFDLGHNCVWYNQLPSWVSSGNFNAATLTSIIQTHCSTIVSHYKGQA